MGAVKMSYKSFVLLLCVPFILMSCASTPDKDQVDSQLINYLKDNQINCRNISFPKKYPEIQKLQIRIAVIMESSNALGKFPNAEELFYYSIISMLSNYFVEVKPGGIIINGQSVQAMISQIQNSKDVDAVLVVTNIKPNFIVDRYPNLYRNLKFTSTFKDFINDTMFSKSLAGFKGEKPPFSLFAQKQLLTQVIFNSVEEIERYLIEQIEEEQRTKRLLAEEENRKAEEEQRKRELLAKLKVKQEQFLQYGFDVLDFVDYAKGTLKTRGEIDFGGAIPEIDFRTFKEKPYVEVKINYLVTYNTLKVSMYDAASMTFDEIVTKLAKKLSTDFKKQDKIAGFIFNVTYTNKDFLEKYDMPRYVTNEFILPKDACRKYADLDITNQDLINQSIVLVDGERISLNLQFSK